MKHSQDTFANEDPIGRRISQSSSGTPAYEIVGVVRHVEQYNLDGQAIQTPQFYLNINQIPADRLPGFTRRINLLTRTDVEPMSLTSAVRGQIAALNKDQPVFNVRTMDQIVAQSIGAAAFLDDVARCFCGCGSGAGEYWNLRDDVLLSRAAHARNRTAHDARRAAWKRTQTRDWSRNETRTRGRCAWV